MTDVPLEWRAVLAKLFAEAEAKGLGTWQPTFHAHPGHEHAAADYIEARVGFVADIELGEAPS